MVEMESTAPNDPDETRMPARHGIDYEISEQNFAGLKQDTLGWPN